MRSGGTTAWWIRFVGGLCAVAVRRDSVVNRGEVRLVIRATSERRDDVIYSVGAALLADVADASVASQNASADVLPVRW